jgi:hypothetical protein
MRLAFFLLLLISLALYAWQQGVLGGLPDTGREPERAARQIEPERIRVLTHDDVKRLREKVKDVPALLASQNLVAGQGCVEFGDFSSELAGRVAPLLGALNLGERMTSRAVELPGWYMVYIPPAKTRADIDRRAEDLKKRGVTEMLVIADNSPMRFGISLGSFRDRDLAQKHRADLEKRGIKDARVADTASSIPGIRFQIKGVDAALAGQLAAMQKEFPTTKISPCGAG